MNRLMNIARIACLAASVWQLACSAPIDIDAGTDATTGPDIATACMAYCQTYGSMCATSASACQSMCVCRALSHQSCAAAIASYVDCASRTALLDCNSGDSLSPLCDDQRAVRDNCLAGAMATDAGTTCSADAATDAAADTNTADSVEASVMGSCTDFCNRQAAAMCANFDHLGCSVNCSGAYHNTPSNCLALRNAYVVCYSNATFMCSSDGIPYTNQCSAERTAYNNCH
jgi:hypothetical protein